MEASVTESKYLGGQQPSEDDWNYSYMLEKSFEGYKLEQFTQEKHPKAFAW
jgi:hypothetical protein